MSKSIFRYALKDGDGTYYFISHSGVLSGSSEPFYMFDVVEWDHMGPIYKRHDRLMGVFDYYIPDQLTFAGDMAKVTRYFFKAYDVLADLFLEIQILDHTTQLYVPMGTYKVDMTTGSSSKLYVQVDIKKGGLTETYLANEDTIYEIPLTDEDDIVLIDGVSMLGTYFYENEVDGQTDIPIHHGEDNKLKTPGIAYTVHEGNVEAGVAKNEYNNLDWNVSTFADCQMFKCIIGSTYNLSGYVPVKYWFDWDDGTRDVKVSLWLYVYNGDNWGSGPSLTHKLWASQSDTFITPAGPGEAYAYYETIYLNYGFTLNDGQSFMLIWRFDSDAPNGFLHDMNAHLKWPTEKYELLLKHTTRQAATPCRAKTGANLFNALLAAMTGGAYTGVSDTLNSSSFMYGLRPMALRYTCGDAIRQIYKDGDGNTVNPVIKTSMKDFIKNNFSILSTGVGIEKDIAGNDILRLETMDHFFDQSTELLGLNDTGDDYKLEPYNIHRANNLTIGYKDQTYDNVNGKYEFNSQQQWKTNINSKMQDLDYTSPYRADVYGIEVLRANLDNKKTTDSSSDNSIFMIHTKVLPETDGMYRPYRGNVVTAGIPDSVRATMYNIGLSPRHCLLRMGGFLLSNYGGVMLDITPNIFFQSGTKNTSLRYFDSVGFSSFYENADIYMPDFIFDTYTGFYRAKKISFHAVIPQELYVLMGIAPYGYIRAHVCGVNIKGYVLNIGETPGNNASYNIELLLTTDTELPDNF